MKKKSQNCVPQISENCPIDLNLKSLHRLQKTSGEPLNNREKFIVQFSADRFQSFFCLNFGFWTLSQNLCPTPTIFWCSKGSEVHETDIEQTSQDHGKKS